MASPSFDTVDQRAVFVERHLRSISNLWTDPHYNDIIRSCISGTPFSSHTTTFSNSHLKSKPTIDISFIAALMGIPEQIFHPRGIVITGCKFFTPYCQTTTLPRFDLTDSHFTLPLKLLGCEFEGTLDLRRGNLDCLDLSDSTLPALMLQGAHLEGALVLENTCISFGEERGQLLSNAANSRNADAPRAGLDANDLVTGGRVYLKGARILGGVRMRHAQIGGDLVAKNAVLISRHYAQAVCLKSPDARVFYLRGIRDKVTLKTIHDRLTGLMDTIKPSCQETMCNTRKYNPDERAFKAAHFYQANIKGTVELTDDFMAFGEVSLNSVTIDGGLFCRGGKFVQHDGVALSMDSIKVNGSVYLDEYQEREFDGSASRRTAFVAYGTVSMRGAVIRNRLVIAKAFLCKDPKKSTLSEPLRERERYAFFAKRLRVGGDMFFNKDASRKPVTGQNWLNVGAISLENAHIGGRLFLAARAGRSFSTQSLRFLNLDFAKIITAAHLQVQIPERTASAKRESSMISLRSAKLGSLDLSGCEHAYITWDLEGLTYESIEESVDKVDKVRIGVWIKDILGKHNGRDVALQPFDALIAYLLKSGQDHAASRVGIAKEDQVTENMARRYYKYRWLHPLFIWRKIIGIFVRYGYQPQRGLVWLFGLIIVGTLVFGIYSGNVLGQYLYGKDTHAIFATRMTYFGYVENKIDEKNENVISGIPIVKKTEYPSFSPFIYSLELATPWLALGQEDHWDIEGHSWVEWYKWLHIIFGWLLSVLIILSPTKLLRRD